MISKINNTDFTLCQMGQGTLFSGVVKNDKEQPVGISFSNDPQCLKDAVVFQINSIEGIAGYLLPLVALMEEWEKQGFVTAATDHQSEEFVEATKALKTLLEPLRPKPKK